MKLTKSTKKVIIQLVILTGEQNENSISNTSASRVIRCNGQGAGEMKDCKECAITFNLRDEKCIFCSNKCDQRSNFKPKEKWRDKLFDGAPIFVESHKHGGFGHEDIIKYYSSCIKDYYESYYRLPTVEEAPRNVWLCPWDDFPKELIEDYDFVLRYKNEAWSFTGDFYPDFQGIINYKDVTSIMILGDL